MPTSQQLWLAAIQICWLSALVATAFFAHHHSLAVLLLMLPIGAFGLITYVMFRRSMRGSAEQAAQARLHVEQLSHYLSEQERVANILRSSEERFRNAFDHASVGMALVSTSGRIIKANPAFASLIGAGADTLAGTDYENLLSGEQLDLHKRELTKLFYGAVNSIQIEQRLRRPKGDEVWVLWSASLIPADEGEPAHYIYQFQNITERKLAENRLAHDALHDGLTGLPNRVLFIDRVQVAFRRAQRGFDVNFAVCYIDFDRFKFVNDTFGHIIGDKLVVQIAERIKSVLRPTDTIARLGGDEFAILVEDIRDIEDVIRTLDRIRAEVAKPTELDGRPVYPTLSIGIAPWSRHYEQPDFLLRDADTALYQAKSAGRNRYEIFSPEMHQTASDYLQTETDLRDAIDGAQFHAVYQPIIDLGRGKLVGFESLVRWEHPRRGLVSPAEFIEIAEETGMIFPIGEWMLRQACSQLTLWQAELEKGQDLWVSVNVSVKQFMQSDLVSIVSGLLKETGLPPKSLKLELTESAMAENIDHVVDVMKRLKALGVRLSIDDFGTGYSSLSNLHRLPLDSLKIDRSFVSRMTDEGEGNEIVKTIIKLAKSLDLAVIAEGLETVEQLDTLRRLRCEMGQGYYFARPLDAVAARQFIIDGPAPVVVPKRVLPHAGDTRTESNWAVESDRSF